MLVNFVNSANEHLASYRMRAQIPTKIFNSSRQGYVATISPELNTEADVNVFSKHFNMKHDANAIITSKTKNVFDVCDDHFDRDAGSYYKFMCDKADVITCNTPNMQERIYEVTGRLAQIVSDPITFPKNNVRYNKNPQILWYGHSSNLSSLSELNINRLPNLTIISDAIVTQAPPHITSLQWKLGLVEEIIDDFDIVIIPKNKNPWAVTKSPNRATDAIAAGKYVVTDFPEVYDCLEPYLWIGNIEEGIKYYINNENVVTEDIIAGQKYLDENYSDTVILQQWIKALHTEREV